MPSPSVQPRYLRIRVHCQSVLADPLIEMLHRFTGRGLETADEDEGLLLTAYLDLDKEARDGAAIAAMSERIERLVAETAAPLSLAPPEARLDLMEAEDWSSTWKRFFKPFVIAPGLIIAPSWEQVVMGNTADQVLRIDPGMAFGTGQHASTRLALGLIREAFDAAPGKIATVLDVGTGTGILSLGCALFGAVQVLAVDNDPEAVDAARENVARNGMGNRVRVTGTDLAAMEGTFDLVCANIVHDVLMAMSEDFLRLLGQGGSLVLAGILCEGQGKSIRAAFEAAGFIHEQSSFAEEWVALRFRKGVC